MANLDQPPENPRDVQSTLQAAAETLEVLEPSDLDDKALQQVVVAIHEHASELLWFRALSRPGLRS